MCKEQVILKNHRKNMVFGCLSLPRGRHDTLKLLHTGGLLPRKTSKSFLKFCWGGYTPVSSRLFHPHPLATKSILSDQIPVLGEFHIGEFPTKMLVLVFLGFGSKNPSPTKMPWARRILVKTHGMLRSVVAGSFIMTSSHPTFSTTLARR